MAANLEERFALLEAEVARLRAVVENRHTEVAGGTRPDFLSTMVGIHANNPAFEEVTRLLEAEREQEREMARQLPAPPVDE